MNKELKYHFLILLLIMLLITACQPKSDIIITPSLTATTEYTPTAIASPTATLPPTPTPTPLPLNGQQTQYMVEATIDYYNRFVSVSSRSVYTNKTATPITEMVFVVYPTLFQNAIYIQSVKTADGTTITNYEWESHRMVIPLENQLLPGETIEFTHNFELYLPNREGTFGQTGRQLNLAYWFPMIPVRDDSGWLINELALTNSQIVGEHLFFESADFDVTIEFSDRRENFKIAAGVIPTETEGMLHYQMPLSRTFTLSISDIYTVAERQVNGIKIFSYTFPEESSAGEAAADLAVQAITLYSELYGPLDRESISLVEADFLHGMEFDGLVLLSRGFYMFYNGTPETNLTIITPHELSHQWFYSMVGNNQALEPWLDESFATYSEPLFYERYHPDLLPWWWENRVDNIGPSGYVDNTIYLEGGYDAYRNSVYLNGAHFVQDLRDTMGDQAFFDFLQAYVNQFRYDIASGEAFWDLLRQFTDADLTPILETYFLNPPLEP